MTGLPKIIFLFLLVGPPPVRGQSILSGYAQNTNFPIQERLSTEKILKIANSRKVFVISFENKGFLPGDFITLIYQDQHVARAIVAKTKNDRVGIKIIKIYSLPLWNQLQKGIEIKVLRGDDSYFVAKKKVEAKEEDDLAQEEIARIMTDDDLFNDKTFLKEDIDNDSRRKSLIKTDNIISAHTGLINTVNLEGLATTDTHFSFAWGHQLSSNFWGEFTYGFSNLSEFPDRNLVTALNVFVVRVKYVFSAPFYSFIKPYVGHKLSVATAPPPNIILDEKTPEEQKALLGEIEYSGPVVGVTILKRLVPGWFVRVDLGTDVTSIGMALEF